MSDGSLSQRDVVDDEEGSGEDLFGDNHADDYRDLGVLDQYDSQMLDDRDVGEDEPDVRIGAERAMAERDRLEGRRRGRRLGAAEESEEDEEYDRERRVRRRVAASGSGDAPQDDVAAEPFDLDNFRVPLKEWIIQEPVKGEVKRRFRNFLDRFQDTHGVFVHERVRLLAPRPLGERRTGACARAAAHTPPPSAAAAAPPRS